MIKVTLGEKPEQLVKPFPKLIKGIDTGWIVEVFEHPTELGKFIGIHRKGRFEGQISFDFSLDKYCIDYNEPITIQNA